MKTSLYARLDIMIFSGVRGMADAALFRALGLPYYFTVSSLWNRIAVEADHNVPRSPHTVPT